MKIFYTLILALVSSITLNVEARDLTPAEECKNFLIKSETIGFQSLSSNGVTTNPEEFNQIIDKTFSQFKKRNRKIARQLQSDKDQIKSHLADTYNDIEKIYLDLIASVDENYKSIYNNPKKSIRGAVYMDSLAADAFSEFKLPVAIQSFVIVKPQLIDYILVEFDGQPQNTDDFIRCNCYLVDNVEVPQPPANDLFLTQYSPVYSWSCSHSIQKVSKVDFNPGY